MVSYLQCIGPKSPHSTSTLYLSPRQDAPAPTERFPFQEASQKIYLLRLLRYLHAQLAHLIIERLAQPLLQWAQRIAKFAFGFFVAAKVGCSDDAQSFSAVCCRKGNYFLKHTHHRGHGSHGSKRGMEAGSRDACDFFGHRQYIDDPGRRARDNVV